MKLLTDIIIWVTILFGLVKIVKNQVLYFVSCVHIHSKQWLYIRHNKTFFPIECAVTNYTSYEDSSFMLFVLCIVNNQFTTLNAQNAQCCSVDICTML